MAVPIVGCGGRYPRRHGDLRRGERHATVADFAGLRLALTMFTVAPVKTRRINRRIAGASMAWSPLIGAAPGAHRVGRDHRRQDRLSRPDAVHPARQSGVRGSADRLGASDSHVGLADPRPAPRRARRHRRRPRLGQAGRRSSRDHARRAGRRTWSGGLDRCARDRRPGVDEQRAGASRHAGIGARGRRRPRVDAVGVYARHPAGPHRRHGGTCCRLGAADRRDLLDPRAVRRARLSTAPSTPTSRASTALFSDWRRCSPRSR